ncbi:MAG: hypothetical protein E6G97_22585 [Alphaproteobacteria bacterium]|nr:MAG: hypothetical protein E6G97_22585 [Alphaproteobacteria bacterium]
MQPFLLIGQLLFGKLPFCSLIGGTVGVIAGSFLGLTMDAIMAGPLSWVQIVEIGLILALVGWITVLIVFGLWLRYGLAQLWLPAAINALLTAILTVWVNELVHITVLAPIIGLVIGLLIGIILCWFCPPFVRLGGWSITHAR